MIVENAGPQNFFVLTATPLASMFGRAQYEQAAAMLLRTLQHFDRSWSPVLPEEIGHVMKELDVPRHPWRNPFFRPDFDGLIEHGVARWVEREGYEGHARPMELTEAAIRRLHKWWRPAKSGVAGRIIPIRTPSNPP